jgi:hypothetical protein
MLEERDGTPAALPRRGQHQRERRSLRVGMPDGHASRREERAVPRRECAEHQEEEAVRSEKRAGRPEEGAMPRDERAALLHPRAPSLPVRGPTPDELAGERSVFLAHRSFASVASLRLSWASRRRGRHARGGTTKALGARSACLPLSRGTRDRGTAAERTGSNARPIRTRARPVRSPARGEGRGAFPGTYRFPTRGQRCADRRTGCPARRSARFTLFSRCVARDSGRPALTSRCSARSLDCFAHSWRCPGPSRRCRAKARTRFTKSRRVIAHVTERPTHPAGEGARESGVLRSARRRVPHTSGSPESPSRCRTRRAPCPR